MTIATMLLLVIGGKIGLRERSLIAESFSALKIGGIVRLVKRVLIGTVIFEGLGAIVLSTVFIPQFGGVFGTWTAIFHSVSAFCNAGFDLMGRVSPGASLTGYVSNITVNVTVMLLILIGGIGFVVWDDIAEKRFEFKKYRLQSKLVLTTTLFLTVAGAIAFYFSEYDYAFMGQDFKTRILSSFFQSVSPRTAGFNTVDTQSLSPSGTVLTILYMVIGASPGSTGGGIKTTTFFVLMFSLISYLRNVYGVNAFSRKVEDGAVERAFHAATFYISIMGIATFLICLQGLDVDKALFEVASAIGTVGLSRGAVTEYTAFSKTVSMLLMYIGRVGSLSVAMAVTERHTRLKVSNVEEKIITG